MARQWRRGQTAGERRLEAMGYGIVAPKFQMDIKNPRDPGLIEDVAVQNTRKYCGEPVSQLIASSS